MESPETAPEPEPSSDAASFSNTWRLRGGSGAPPPETPREPAWPAEIAHYRLERPLGRGSFGQVLAAVDTLTGASVALKLVEADDSERVAALRLEAEWLAAINRPNVPKIFGHGTDRGWAWLAIELVEGPNLADIIAGSAPDSGATARSAPDFDVLLEERSSTEASSSTRRGGGTTWFRRAPDPRIREIMGWFRDLARTLHDIHELGVIHRDIKPANIVIHRGGLPYLVDFGLGIDEFDASGQNLYLAGTLPYMSPEQAGGGTGGIGPQSDLYSLAVTFHEALTGQRVVQGSSRTDTVQLIRDCDVPPPSSVNPELPPSLDPIFTHACQKNPKLRHADGAQLAEDIEAWLAGRPPVHAPESARMRRRRWTRRSVGALAGLAVVALVIAFGLSRSRRAEAFEEIRAAASQERYTEALEACLRHAPAYRNDSEFLELYKNADEGSAVRRIRDFLVLLGVSSGNSGPEPHLEASAQRAREHLNYRPESTSFRFIEAAATYLQGYPEAALKVLAEPGKGALIEDELRAVCYLENPEDTERFLRQLEVIEKHPEAALRSVNDLYMEAWRELTHANTSSYEARQDSLGDPAPHYQRAREILTLVPKPDEPHGAVRAMMASLELNAGNYSKAREHYSWLANRLESTHTPASRLEPLYNAGITGLLAAAELEGDQRRLLEGLAFENLREVLRNEPKRTGDLIEKLWFRAWLPAWIAVQWLWTNELIPSRACDRTVEILSDMVKKAPETQRREAVPLLAEILEAQWFPNRPKNAKTCIRGAQTYSLSMLGEQVLEARRKPDAASAAIARRMIDTEARLQTAIGLERYGRFWILVACDHLALHGEPEERTSALEHLATNLPRLIEEFAEEKKSETRTRYLAVIDDRLRTLRCIESALLDR